MNGIIGMTELTLDSDLNRSQRESLLLVHSLARSLLLIIDDILDISKSASEYAFDLSHILIIAFLCNSRSWSHDDGTGVILYQTDRIWYLEDLSRPGVPEPAGSHI